MPRDASLALIGRRAELEQLDEAWEHAIRAEPRVVMVGGDAGMGKTRLIAESLARRTGERITAIGGCVPVAEGSLSYAPFVEILRSLAASAPANDPAGPFASLAPASRAELGRLVPSLRPADASVGPADDALARARLFEAVVDLVVRVATRLPTLLVVEDLHWADGSSLDLLGYLIRNLRAERALIIATYRTDELHRRHPLRPWIAEISRLRPVDRMDLPSLDPEDVRPEIARLLGTGAQPRLVERIIERADGNPLFATELIAFVQGHGNAEGLPEIVREGFLRRLETLGPDGQLVARHLAIIGRPATGQLLQRTCGCDPDRVQAGLREALDALVIAISAGRPEGRFEMRHALLGEAVVDDLLPNERSALHRDVADALDLAGDGDDDGDAERARIAGEVAYHRWAAHDTDRAITASIRAAMAAANVRAYAEADSHWGRVLEAWPGRGPNTIEGFDLPEAMLEAAGAAAALGANRRAADLAERSLDLIDSVNEPLRAAEVHRRLGWYLILVDSGAAFVHGASAVRLIPPGDPPPEAARILADHAALLALRFDLDRAEQMAGRALELAARYKRPDAEVLALQALGNCIVGRSRHAAAIDMHRDAFALADRLGDAEGLMATGNGLAWCLNDAGLHQEVQGLGDRFEARIGELGVGRRYGWELHYHRERALLHLGRWREAEASMEARLSSRDLSPADRATTASVTACLRTRQARLDEARELCALADGVEGTSNPEPLDWSLEARCEITLAEHRWLDVREIVAAAFARIPIGVRPMVPDLRPYALYGLRAEAEIALDARVRRDPVAEADALRIARDLEAWVRHLAQEVTAAHEPLSTTTVADATLAAALLTRVERHPDPVIWRSALELHAGLGHPYVVAQIRFWLAVAILDSGGSRSSAAGELALALAAARELGAVLLEREIRDLARRARLEPLDAAQAATSNPTLDDAAAASGSDVRDRERIGSDVLAEPLTPREREVLSYLAAGWTNRRIGDALFISDKTVSVHVSNLLGKLGAANRAEAALIGDRLGLVVSTEQP